MSALHGIIVASGNATRFARSVNGQIPYPKHLESIAGSSVLSHAVSGMVQYTPVDSVCVTVHPALADLYQAEVSQIQERTSVPVHLVNMMPIDNSSDVSGSVARTVFEHQGWNAQDLLVYAFGDVVMCGPQTGMRKYIQDNLHVIETGQTIELCASNLFGGTLFALAKYGYLSDTTRFSHQISARWFNIVFWNINTKKDLLTAEQEMATLPEGSRKRGKER